MSKKLKLSRELSRLELINDIVDNISQFSNKELTEALNIIERWILSLCNDYDSSDVDPFFDKRKLSMDHFGSINFLSECKAKSINLNFIEIITKVDAWIDNLTRCQNKDYPEPILIGNILKISGHYIHVFPPDRLDAIYNRCDDIYDLAIMCIRYSCILQRGQQWTNDIELYKFMVEKYNLDIEGFSSPLNSQLLQLKSNANICTLFPDTDSSFGSLGSFFDQNFIGKNVAAFLPYVESIFDKVLDLVIDNCEFAEKTGKPIRFFIGTSGWDDTKIVTTLNNYKYTKKKISTIPYKHYFHDTNTDNIIISSFKNYYYVVSVNFDDTYDDLDFKFSSIERKTLIYIDIKNKVRFTKKIKDILNIFNQYGDYHSKKFICDTILFHKILPSIIYKELIKNKHYSSHILYEILSENNSHISIDKINQLSEKYTSL